MTHPFTHASMQAKTLFTRTSLLASVAPIISLTLSVALSLSACGGGGSDPEPTTPTTPTKPTTSPTSSLTQGRWASTGLNPVYTAIMVPAPTGANTQAVDTVWALAQDASVLIKLKANGAAQTAGAVTGNVYTLGRSSVTAVSSASYTIQTTAATATSTVGHQISIQPLLGTTALFNRTDAMSTALSATQANGKWQADLGTAKVNWTVDTSAANVNNLSGTSTTGCTYSGQSTVVTAQSLYKVQFTETCSGSGTPTAQTFTGIATLNADSTRLTVVATNDAETRATALLLVKQP
jgi:hypothetical protein